MQHARRILPIMTAFALFFTLATPAAFASGSDGKTAKGKTTYQVDGTAKGKKTFHLVLKKVQKAAGKQKAYKAKGKWTINVGKAYNLPPLYSHTSKKLTGNEYFHFASKKLKLSPGKKYEVYGEFDGTVHGKKVVKGVLFKIQVTKNHNMKVIKKRLYF
ncbi:hypothetical protein SAMN05444487_103196 [Marininema mesophilum]|uniref:Uncharacterized protein n=1 Tax=Marininema mesophilum TaxID=1048340 RepID=A0A1H2TQ98_9BACL|nr:hypothetical protein [Marininema mesophilum]SDW45464.1 hypothetical protein SAMN05444487_103196 [Marininema mesophilum]